MLPWEKPAFGSPFELWREDGLLQLVLAKDARMEVRDMKELLRLIAALDREGRTPVVIELGEAVTIDDCARALLQRVCSAQGHPVSVFTMDRGCRLQAELFRSVYKPRFPYKIFSWREEAFRWARERRQLAVLVDDPAQHRTP